MWQAEQQSSAARKGIYAAKVKRGQSVAHLLLEVREVLPNQDRKEDVDDVARVGVAILRSAYR